MNTTEQLKQYGIETILEWEFKGKSRKKVPVYKVKDVELKSAHTFEILEYLFANKNEYVDKEKIIEIRKRHRRYPNAKMINIEPEISKNISILNSAFKKTELDFYIHTTTDRKVMLTVRE